MTRRPIVNYAIIAINVALFIGCNYGVHSARGVDGLLLHPDNPSVQQFFSSMFMHGSWTHLIGNMIFLWVFGNAVNDRFGHAGYLAFYLAGGILAGVGYLLLSGNAPVLGASGAISAVTGAYLVLLPRARVTLLLWLFYLFLPLDVSSLYFLLFQFVWNMVMSFNQSITATPGVAEGGVAYIAHSSGYLFGILVSVAILAGRLIDRNHFDLLSLAQSALRRSEYRGMVAKGYDPFIGKVGSRWTPAKSAEPDVPDMRGARELELRREISQALSDHDLAAAAPRYLELIQIAPQAVLSRQQQLDVANHLMSAEQHAEAAEAYERFLKHYGGYEYVADIYLMLGLLYGRYLQKTEQAVDYLQRAIASLRDPRKLELARGDLELLQHPEE
jgi:membrane associated rhomboid family serine protease